VGCIPFSPLAQGLLTNRYLKGIPKNSRIGRKSPFLKNEELTPEVLQKISRLDDLAQKRGQSLAQMALAWILRYPCITSVLIGASSVDQLKNNLQALDQLSFTPEELKKIDSIVK
jgi:L-glyceraldehyde 3-phosphate reductase